MELKTGRKRRRFYTGTLCVLCVCAALSFFALTSAAQQSPAAATPMQQSSEAAPAAQAANPAPAPQDANQQAGSQATPPPANPQAEQPSQEGTQTVHIVVGHSLLIHTPSRVKRILTGNPAVVESVVTSPAELVITAKAPGSSSLMLWDEAGRNRYLDVYADLDVASLRNSVDQSFPYSTVDIESQGEKVLLVGTVPSKDVADQMQKMADNFSKEVVNGLRIAPPPRDRQVVLKVRFAEADRQKLTAFGFNIFSAGAANTLGITQTQQFGPLTLQTQNNQNVFTFSDFLNVFLFRPDINLGAVIKDLQQRQVLQILAEPNLMAISGQPAHFLAGGEFPYPVVQGGAAGSVPTVTVQFKPFGVKLEFTGIIEENNTIRLKVAPEVSTLDYSNAVTISGFILPALSTRRAETEIELKDGQSFGIAGLLDQRTTVQLSKMPGIGDIPIIGELFKSRNANFTNTELIVLVTPTIVDPVAGAVPTNQPEVTFPMRKLDTGTFDKNLPYAPKNPEATK